MKKLLFVSMIIIFSSALSAQEKKDNKVSYFVSGGISIGHVDPSDESINNFNKASFPSIEFGITRKNSYSAVFGVENVFATSMTRGFYELKTSVSYPLTESSSIYGLFGTGAYFERAFNQFIEYGAGYAYTPGKLGYFSQYSNWARTNYVSVGMSYSF